MLSSDNKGSAFEMVTVTIAVLVTVFIFTAMAAIVICGVPYLNQVFESREVQFAILLSLKTSCLSTAICLLLGIPTAYALTRTDFKLKGLSGIIVELPLSIPNIMLGLSLLLIFSSMPGKYLSAHGFSVIFNVKGIVIAHILVNLPFVIRIIKTAFMEMDPRLELIAGTLGASRGRSFFSIILPLAGNSITGAAVIAWSRAMGEFGATLMFVGATRMKTETLPTSIFLNMATGDTGQAMACAMIILIMSGAALLISTLADRSSGASRGRRLFRAVKGFLRKEVGNDNSK